MSNNNEQPSISPQPDSQLSDGSTDWGQDASNSMSSGNDVMESDTSLTQSTADGQQYEDDSISSLAYLQKFGASSNASERQNAAKNIVKTLQNVEQDETAVQVIFVLIRKTFAEDQDAVIRGELLEQLPMICMHCSQAPSLAPYIREVLYPLLVQFLNDLNTQVRKTCQAAILILVEQGLLTVDDIVELIYPELMKLSGSCFPDDVRVEAVFLLCKLVTTLGRERTIKLFLKRFTELCDDPVFHVRKTCASHLGEMSRVLGHNVTEELLVPHLISLSQDSVWGVRKTCAECFTDISYNSAMQTRRHELAPVFIMLLADNSRWVQCSAFQALGPFIATFADSSRTGLRWVEGELVYREPQTSAASPRSTASVTPAPLSFGYSLTDREQSTVAGDVDDERIGLSSLLDNVVSTASAITSNIAQLAKQRLNGDMTRVETCIVDLTPSMLSEVYYAEIQRRTANAMNDTPEDQSSFSTYQTGVKTEFQSFKFWQSNYYDIDSVVACESTLQPLDAVTSTSQNDDSAGAGEIKMGEFRKDESKKDDPNKEESKDGSGTNNEPCPIPAILDSIVAAASAEENEPDEAPVSDENGLEAEKNLESESASESIGSNDRDAEESSPENPSSEQKIVSFYQKFLSDRHLSYVSHDHSNSSLSPNASPKQFDYQDIIPQALLDQFLSMVEPSRAQAIESDISRHCAFNLPAVAFTIGRQHWPLIKPTYLALANDMQWKVRRTLAFSIHELAAILGTELTVQDLLPVFSGFLRDLDEVRIGILGHLYDFLKLLNKDVRRSLLPSLADFLQTDNYRSWRFRHLFAQQLISLCELFDIEDINDYLSPIAMTLAIDKISEIRQVTHKLLATILCYFYKVEAARSEICDITDSFIQDIVKGFAKSQRWVRRQTFIYVCREVFGSSAVSERKFASHLLPPLLSLAQDKIPNVRIALSALFAEIYYTKGGSRGITDYDPLRQVVQAITLLSLDSDRDVRINAVLGVDRVCIMARELTSLCEDPDTH